MFGQTTLYRIVINIAHVFRAFNFCTSHAVRKYFNIEIFAIYGMSRSCWHTWGTSFESAGNLSGQLGSSMIPTIDDTWQRQGGRIGPRWTLASIFAMLDRLGPTHLLVRVVCVLRPWLQGLPIQFSARTGSSHTTIPFSLPLTSPLPSKSSTSLH